MESIESHVLSIQSHVVQGYVGNRSATFPLQVHGFEVDCVNSVQFSNHTGYGKWKGTVLDAKDLEDLIAGLRENSLLSCYSHLLTGYIANQSFLHQVLAVVKELKELNPNLVYVCDPVLGDNEKLYVPAELVPIYASEVISVADILTPNQFEAELLTGMKINSDEDAIKVMDHLHVKGVKVVVLSSTNLGTDDELISFASHVNKAGLREVYRISLPRVDQIFTGTGDLFAALFLVWTQKTNWDIKTSLENTQTSLQGVIHKTLEHAKQNGCRSFENPNYQLALDPVLADAFNSNAEPSLSTLAKLTQLGLDVSHLTGMEADYCIDFEAMGIDLERMRSSQSEMTTARSRRIYAKMDVSSMGVDVDTGPVIADNENNKVSFNDNARNSLAYELSLESTDSKNASQEDLDGGECKDLMESAASDKTEESCEEDLPPGWERHEDSDGPYYWHVKSGTIQRDAPTRSESREAVRQLVRDAESLALTGGMQTPLPPMVARSSTTFNLAEIASDKSRDDMAFKRRSYPSNPTQDFSTYSSGCKPIRFAVRSLGWVEIGEEELTPEKSSKAVNRCIVDLSLGKNELLDAVGRWGDGKDLFLDLDEASLKLVDPESLTILNSQAIHTIRVWGVGRDNGRDFAYVARDKATRLHKCHVFRCDTPARIIANTLRDICKKIMIERSLAQSMSRPLDLAGCGLRGGAIRPNNLPTQQRKGFSGPQVIPVPSFPTPMEEPRKTLRALYVGSTPVPRPSGIELLNEAIDKLVISVDPDRWIAVNVSVAPSVVTVFDANDEDNVVLETRVRFLSFLGIGRNVRHCGFIIHTAQDTFVAHVFVCEPSSAALCKTVEAACKLRFQKCMDAHGQSRARATAATTATTPSRGLETIGAALKSVIGSIKKRGKSETSS